MNHPETEEFLPKLPNQHAQFRRQLFFCAYKVEARREVNVYLVS